MLRGRVLETRSSMLCPRRRVTMRAVQGFVTEGNHAGRTIAYNYGDDSMVSRANQRGRIRDTKNTIPYSIGTHRLTMTSHPGNYHRFAASGRMNHLEEEEYKVTDGYRIPRQDPN